MKIDVRINSLMPDNGSVKVMEGKNGLFVSMPSQKGKDGNYHGICFSITPEFRSQINSAVEQAYCQAITQVQEQKNVGFTQTEQSEAPAMEMSM